MMKIKIDLSRKYVFALGFILFFINPSVALTADTVARVEAIEGTAWAQSTGEETRKLEKDSLIEAFEHTESIFHMKEKKQKLQEHFAKKD